jgi:hypothetical protein
MRRLAMRSVLSAKAADGQILVIDSFTDLEPRTKVMLSTLAALNLADRRVLIMTPERQDNLELAAGNLKNVTTMRTQYLSLVAMLKAEILVLDRASLTVIESILGQTGGRTSRPIAAPEGAAPSRLASVLDGEPAAPAAEAPAVGGATVTSTITAAPPPATSPVESPVETEADTAAADTEALETQGEEENV